MATKHNGGETAASQHETNDEINSVFDARLALETQRAKVNSMVGALGLLADSEPDQAPLFFTLLNALEPVDTELERIIYRMAAIDRCDQPASTADAYSADFYRRTYEEWSAALIAATEAGDEASEPRHAHAEKLCDRLVKNNATTAGDAALKLRAISHGLFVTDFAEDYPDASAALASLLADLERIDAAEKFSRRAGKAVAS